MHLFKKERKEIKYLKTYESLIIDPQVGDYIKIYSDIYRDDIGVISDTTDIHDETYPRIKVKFGSYFHTIDTDEIRFYAKTIDEIYELQEKEDKEVRNLRNKLQYNLNKFFERGVIVKSNSYDAKRITILAPYSPNMDNRMKIRWEIYVKALNSIDEYRHQASIHLTKRKADILLNLVKKFPEKLMEKEAEMYNL